MKGLIDMNIKDIEELIHNRSDELAEDDLMKFTVPEAEALLDREEDKFTLKNIAEGLCKFESVMNYFYNIGPSMFVECKGIGRRGIVSVR